MSKTARSVLRIQTRMLHGGNPLLYQKQETGGYDEKATIIGFRAADGGKWVFYSQEYLQSLRVYKEPFTIC